MTDEVNMQCYSTSFKGDESVVYRFVSHSFWGILALFCEFLITKTMRL